MEDINISILWQYFWFVLKSDKINLNNKYSVSVLLRSLNWVMELKLLFTFSVKKKKKNYDPFG